MHAKFSHKTNFHVELSGLPDDISAYELFYLLNLKLELNILGVAFRNKSEKNKAKLESSEIRAMIFEYLINPNSILCKKSIITNRKINSKSGNPNGQKSDLEASKTNSLGFKTSSDYNAFKYLEAFIKKTDDILMGNHERVRITNSGNAVLDIRDKESKKYIFQQDLWISGYYIISKIRDNLEIENDKNNNYFYNKTQENLYPWSYCNLENFSFSIIKKRELYEFWNFANTKRECFKPLLFFNICLPYKKYQKYFSLDLIFTMRFQLDFKISFEFSEIEIYQDEFNNFVMHIHLLRHPSFFCDQVYSQKYKAPNFRNWQRIPNYCVQGFEDNLFKVIAANNSILTIRINKTEFNDKLETYFTILEEFDKIKYISKNYLERPFYEFNPNIASKLSNTKFNDPKLHYLILVLISYDIIDILNDDESFLNLIKDYRETNTMISALERIIFQQKLQHSKLSFDDFKSELKQYLDILTIRNGLTDIAKEKYFFDMSLYSPMLEITPSCIYYSYVERNQSKSIEFKKPELMKDFLAIKFIDEDLSLINEVSPHLEMYYKLTMERKTNLLEKKYKFLYYSPDQIEQRLFWYLSIESKSNYNEIIKWMEDNHLVDGWKDELDKSEAQELINLETYYKRIFGSLQYCYDIIDIKQDNIKITLRSWKNENFGFIASNILEKLCTDFGYEYIPCISVRILGKEIFLLTKSSIKNQIEISDSLFKIPEQIEIINIMRIGRKMQNYFNFYLINKMTKIEFISYGSSILFDKLAREYLESLINRNKMKQLALIEHPNGQKSQLIKNIINQNIDDFFATELSNAITAKGLNLIRSLNILLDDSSCQLMAMKDPFDLLKEGEVYFQLRNMEIDQTQVLIVNPPGKDDKEDFKLMNINKKNSNHYSEYYDILFYSGCKGNEFLDKLEKNDVMVIWKKNIIECFQNFSIILREEEMTQKNLIKEEISNNNSITQKKEDKVVNQEDSSQFLEQMSNISTVKQIKSLNSKFNPMLFKNFFKTLKYPTVFCIELFLLSEFESFDSKDFSNFNNLLERLKIAYNTGNENLSIDFQKSRFFQKLNNKAFSDLLDIHQNINIIYIDTNIKRIFNYTNSIEVLLSGYDGIKINKNFIRDNFEKYLKTAIKIMILYKIDIQLLMSFYNCKTESEIFIGKYSTDSKPISFSSRYVKKSKFNVNSLMLSDFARIIEEKYKLKFHNPRTEKVKDKSDLYDRASALYVASIYKYWTKHEKLKNFYINNQEISKYLHYLHRVGDFDCFGFPWICAGDYLIEMSKL